MAATLVESLSELTLKEPEAKQSMTVEFKAQRSSDRLMDYYGCFTVFFVGFCFFFGLYFE